MLSVFADLECVSENGKLIYSKCGVYYFDYNPKYTILYYSYFSIYKNIQVYFVGDGIKINRFVGDMVKMYIGLVVEQCIFIYK